MSEKFISKAVNENGDVTCLESCAGRKGEGASVMIADDSETLCTCVTLTSLRLWLWFFTYFAFCALATRRNAYCFPQPLQT